jgi:acetyl esterase
MSRGHTLDPQAKELLSRAERSSIPALHTVTPEQARSLYREMRKPLQPPAPSVSAVVDAAFDGPGGAVAARIYRPAGSHAGDALPVVVYFHGGGWTFGDLDTHDVPCRTLANFGHFAVASIDYRLAPEHKFPAAIDDAFAAVQWVARDGAALGLDPKRIAVAGDSAGGNLAAAAAMLARDAGLPLMMQALIYPAVDMRADTPSHFEFAKGYVLDRDAVLWNLRNYLRTDEDARDPRASPLLASDHRGLAPAYIITAGFDPLLDEGAAYAGKLTAAGVAVTYECFEGMVHGFITMGRVLAAANHALYRTGLLLRNAFKAAR